MKTFMEMKLPEEYAEPAGCEPQGSGELECRVPLENSEFTGSAYGSINGVVKERLFFLTH